MTTTPTIRRRTFLAASLAAVASASAACGFGDDGDASNEEGQEPDSPDGGGGVLRQIIIPPPTLDPATAGGARHSNILQAALLEGLLVFDETGQDVIGGAAESWEASDNGLVYTFAIRSEATWSNGDPVTAEDFAWNWQRLLTPPADAEGANPSYPPATGVVGAAQFLNGEIDDFNEVGVKAIDDTTLEITLEAPNPDLPFLLALYWGLPLHPGTVEEHGSGWMDPENWVGNGAYLLESFVPNASAVLVPNDTYWDRDSYHLDSWEFRFSDAGTTADILAYNNDETDIIYLGGALTEVTSDPELEAEIATSPNNQIRNLQLMTSRHPALHDVNVRKALSLAIDRDQLAQITMPDVPARSLVPDAVVGYDQIPGISFDVAQAQQLLADAGYADGEGMPTINLLTFESNIWLEAIGEMWRQNLGVDTAIDLVEVGVWRDKRAEVHPESYSGFFYSNQGVNPPTLLNATKMGPRIGGTFMPADATEQYQRVEQDETLSPEQKASQLRAIEQENTYPKYAEFAQLAQAAQSELDPSRREQMLVDALTAREESFTRIPVLWGGYNHLVKPRVKDLVLLSDGSAMSTKGATIEG